MNILPKKRWHVRTKDNIARVRKDEALAAEEEKKKQLRIQIAEREKRRDELRKRARERTGIQISETSPKTEARGSPDKHVNLFYELEQNEVVSDQTNKEYLKEKQLEKEKYEKQIGYLTYLGQDTNEITGNVSWYNKPREELHGDQKEIAQKQKSFEDPLGDIRKYLGCEGIQKIKDSVKSEEKVTTKKRCSNSETHAKRKKQKKKHKKRKKKKDRKRHSTSESEESESESEPEVKRPSVDLERLRAERIRREAEERKRANELFAKLNGVTVKEEKEVAETCQRYNSQFNPHLAKQNNVYR